MHMDVMVQVREAFRPRNRAAACTGLLLGGLVPILTWSVAHRELDWSAGVLQLPVLMVAGGLLFSALTVFEWSRTAFNSWPKALGFVVLLELVLVGSRLEWLTLAALVYLVAINATATAANLALAGQRSRRREAVVKRKSRRAARILHAA